MKGLGRTLYFMALVGALAGLVCWGTIVWIPELLAVPQEYFWLLDLGNVVWLGGLLGAFSVGFSDHWSGDRILARWIVVGACMGMLFGGIAATVALAVVRWSELFGWQSRVATWTLAGSLVGLGIGLRWWSLNRRRALHAFLGGGVGGLSGGLIFASMSSQAPDLSQALGLMLTGTGIALGVNIAPALMSRGSLTFVESTDQRAQRKYSSTGKSWELQDGDRLTIGSLGADKTATMYSQEIQVFLPDEQIAPKHAIVTGRRGRFFIERHPESIDPQGFFNYALQVQGKDVRGLEPLSNGNNILIGSTRLVFLERKHRNA